MGRGDRAGGDCETGLISPSPVDRETPMYGSTRRIPYMTSAPNPSSTAPASTGRVWQKSFHAVSTAPTMANCSWCTPGRGADLISLTLRPGNFSYPPAREFIIPSMNFSFREFILQNLCFREFILHGIYPSGNLLFRDFSFRGFFLQGISDSGNF